MLNPLRGFIVFVVFLFYSLNHVEAQNMLDSRKVEFDLLQPTFELGIALPVPISGRKVIFDGHVGIGFEINLKRNIFTELQLQGIAKSAGHGLGMMGSRLGIGHRFKDDYKVVVGSGFYFATNKFDAAIPGYFVDVKLSKGNVGIRAKYDKMSGTEPWDHETLSVGWTLTGKPAIVTAGTATVVGGIVLYVIGRAIAGSR